MSIRGRGGVVGRALLALVAGLILGTVPPHEASVSGEGFVLSKRADFATQDRTFTRNDTLYMRVWSERIDDRRMRTNAWRLDSGAAGVRDSLSRRSDGSFTASFQLSALPSSATTWSWRGRLEDRRGRAYTPFADITVQPVAPPPAADFVAAPTTGMAPLTVAFSDRSTGSPTSWAWDFGDGATSNLRNPTHGYANPGTYSVRLTATNAAGSNSVLRSSLVSVAPPPPIANLSASPTSGTAPLRVDFVDLSSNWPASWTWDFGDGASSALRNPAHEYASSGTYSVTLVVANESGTDTRTLADLITVEPPAFAIEYGMNSSENVWSQRGIAFADAMARASEFCVVDGQITATLAPTIPLGRAPALLGEGWPDFYALSTGTKAGARLFGSMKGTLPDGRTSPYVVTWEGTGSCRLSGPSVVAESNRTANRVEVFVDPSVGPGSTLVWILDASSRTDPVRNVHVWLPGMETTKSVLWPPFVEKLQALNGGRGPRTWRAMDWCQVRQYGRTDGPAPFVFDLAGRITPKSPSQGSRRGVCPEFQVALCNAVGANLHFNVPHQANGLSDADYAAFVRAGLIAIRDGSPAVPGINGDRPFAGLAPGLTLTLEYSNETWNGSFPVNAWLRARAQANGRTLHQQIALEIQRVFAIADEVFSGPDAVRLRKYVGGRLGDPTFLQRVLEALPRGTRIDAVGPACYFGPRQEDIDAWLVGAGAGACPNCPTPDAVVASARLSIPLLGPKLAQNRIVAESFVNPDGSSPAFVLYEAGPSFVANLQPWAAAAVQAQSLPALYDAYVLDLVPMLIAEGVAEVNWYSFVSDNAATGNGAGPFGHWDNMNQSLTLPVREPYLDEGVPKAAAIYKLPPVRH